MTLLAHQTEQKWAAYILPGMSTGVILREAVMPTSYSQGRLGLQEEELVGTAIYVYHQQHTWSHL